MTKPGNLSTLDLTSPPLCSGRLTTTLLFSQISQGRHIYEVIVTDANGLRVSNQISFESKLKKHNRYSSLEHSLHVSSMYHCTGQVLQRYDKNPKCLSYRYTYYNIFSRIIIIASLVLILTPYHSLHHHCCTLIIKPTLSFHSSLFLHR